MRTYGRWLLPVIAIAAVAAMSCRDQAMAAEADTATQMKAMQRSISTLERRAKELAEELRRLQQRNEKLRKEAEEAAKEATKATLEALEAVTPADPSKGTVPAYADSKAPGAYINDIACRPKLALTKDEADKAPDPLKKSRCHMLWPSTRLLFENLNAGAGYNYSNIAGSPNIGANYSIVKTRTSTYQVGVGYYQKPILRQLRSLLVDSWDDPTKAPSAVINQGSTLEDFVFNAVLLSGGVAYGRTLQIKDGEDIKTGNARASYGVGISYSLDLERAYVHLFHGGDDTRPVDAGYYFTPKDCAGFWSGGGCGVIR